MKRLIICLLFASVVVPTVAFAGDAGVAMQDAGSATPSLSPAADAPSDKLHDPASAPSAAWNDLKAAKKVGWPLALFAGLVMLCRLLGRANQYKGYIGMLGKGKTAVVVGAVGALAAACYNAAVDGGAWTAVMMSGIVGLAHYLDSGSDSKKSGRGKK